MTSRPSTQSSQNQQLTADASDLASSEQQNESSAWRTYKNKELHISFQIPVGWPEPVVREGEFVDNGSYIPNSAALWRIFIGPVAHSTCEGEDCYIYYFDGWSPQHADEITASLKNHELIEVEQESRVNGNRIVVYKEGGICGYRNAFIFYREYTARFTAACGEDNPEMKATFDKILSTITIGWKSE